jgi:hypothetical protein
MASPRVKKYVMSTLPLGRSRSVAGDRDEQEGTDHFLFLARLRYDAILKSALHNDKTLPTDICTVAGSKAYCCAMR